jgi:putative ABC transport system permease protein
MRGLRISLEGLRTLAEYRLQSCLMMTGVVIGIAALVVILALGKGTEKRVMKRVSNFGPRAMMLISGGGKDLPPPDVTVTTLSLEDVEAVREGVEGLEIVTPMAWKLYTPVKRESNQALAVIWGVEPQWHQAYNWYAEIGEEISAADVASLARVCLIGKTVSRKLFPNSDPVGGRVYLNKVALTVKGVLSEMGTSPGGGDFDNKIILPITTAMRRVFNVDYIGAVRIITADPDRMEEQAGQIKQLMSDRHHIVPPRENDFRVVTAKVIARIARGISRTLYHLLLALAAISLLISGVVIMNLMLISVNARKSEIGLRRASGATKDDIFRQFLAESLTVTILGVILGGLLGWAVCIVLQMITKMPLIMSWSHFATAAIFAVAVACFFGVQPARKAAALNPVEALR